VKRKILFAPRIKNDQRIELFWRETKINPNDGPSNTRRTSVWALVKVYLRRENSPIPFLPRALPLAVDNALSGL
jgi:hypothetical protein